MHKLAEPALLATLVVSSLLLLAQKCAYVREVPLLRMYDTAGSFGGF